jgi:hypothetical protein
MQQISIQLSTLPLNIVFLENSTIAIVPISNFNTLIDGAAIFNMSGFSVGGVSYEYSTSIEYKNEPELLEYLKSLALDINLVYNSFAMQQHMNGFNFSF